MSVKISFYNEYDIKNNEKPVFWAQRGFQNHHQTFHDRCPEKIGPLPKNRTTGPPGHVRKISDQPQPGDKPLPKLLLTCQLNTRK